MLLELLKAKVHRIKVTNSDINYEGSIFIDRKILEHIGIKKYEKVDVYNINNGARFSTYAVPEDIDCYCQVNGAAARLVYEGDLLIVCAFGLFTEDEAANHKPKVALISDGNKIKND